MLELFVKVVVFNSLCSLLTLNSITLYFIVCDALSNPVNGGVTTIGRGVDDRATYYCDYGYDLIGDVTVRCRLNGKWSRSPPICRG